MEQGCSMCWWWIMVDLSPCEGWTVFKPSFWLTEAMFCVWLSGATTWEWGVFCDAELNLTVLASLKSAWLGSVQFQHARLAVCFICIHVWWINWRAPENIKMAVWFSFCTIFFLPCCPFSYLTPPGPVFHTQLYFSPFWAVVACLAA